MHVVAVLVRDERDMADDMKQLDVMSPICVLFPDRYFVELEALRSMLGASMSSALICVPLVFPLSGWLRKRCGSHYIFIIGLLLYSIRFLGNPPPSHPAAGTISPHFS